ncbi:unnamed protein product [Fusarium graminearum]|nr:unnamed protein product [Fusarium graminearum]
MSDSTQLSDVDPAIARGPTNFLCLPAEIRNAIYESTLLDSRRVRIITELFTINVSSSVRLALGILESISTSCTGLSTLRTSLGTTAYMESRLCDLFDGNRATEALQLANTHFRAFPSRPEIILEVYEDAPSAFLRASHQGYKLGKLTDKSDFDVSLDVLEEEEVGC